MIYGLHSALDVDIDVKEFGTVMVKVSFLITNYSLVTLKCGYYVNMPEGILKHKYIKKIQVFFPLSIEIKLRKAMSWNVLDSLRQSKTV